MHAYTTEQPHLSDSLFSLHEEVVLHEYWCTLCDIDSLFTGFV